MAARNKPGFVPRRRYRPRKGETRYDRAVKREKLKREQGIPVTAVPATDLPIPEPDERIEVTWCEPLDFSYRSE